MPWNKAPPAPVPLRLRDPNAVAEQQKDVTAWDFKDWISGCSLQYGIFGSFFWKLIENVEDTKKNSVRFLQFLKSISEVFQSMWSWDFAAGFFGSRSSSEAATPLGRHGTYDEVRDFDLCQKKQEKTSKKIWGSLDSRDSYRFSYRFCDSLGENRVFLGVGVLTGPVASHQGGYRNSQPVTSLASWELPCCFLPSQLSSD